MFGFQAAGDAVIRLRPLSPAWAQSSVWAQDCAEGPAFLITAVFPAFQPGVPLQQLPTTFRYLGIKRLEML